MLTSRYDEAFLYAHKLHRSQTRKGTSIPYISKATWPLIGGLGAAVAMVDTAVAMVDTAGARADIAAMVDTAAAIVMADGAGPASGWVSVLRQAQSSAAHLHRRTITIRTLTVRRLACTKFSRL